MAVSRRYASPRRKPRSAPSSTARAGKPQNAPLGPNELGKTRILFTQYVLVVVLCVSLLPIRRRTRRACVESARLISWLLEQITRHPDVLAYARAAAHDGDDDYLDAVIKEAMRLRPVAPMTCRLATQDFELPGLTLPAGTIVSPYITLVHRRGDIWEDPLEFRPERFLDTQVNAFAWIPFGGGRRRCLGAAFSLLEARVVLRTILRNTNLVPNPRRPERISRSNVFLLPGRGGSVRLDHSTMAFGFATSN
jgi:hypothetical protein